MKKKLSLFFAIILTVSLLTACGASNATPASETADMAAAYSGAYATDDVYLANGAAMADTESAAVTEMAAAPEEAKALAPEVPEMQTETGVQSARKLIRNANMTVETEEFDGLMATVEEKVTNLGGYMESYSSSKNSMYYGGNENRYASLTIRIPAISYGQFVNEVSAISNVLNRNESVQDVTLQYVDLESHKKVLRTEHTRLLELLEKAESIEDIIVIENRLSDVGYQIESMESQLRTYDNLVDYSTIYLSVNEVKQLTPVQELTDGEKISTGFVNSCKTLGTGFKNLFIGLIIASPFLVVIAAVTVITVFSVKFVKKRKEKSEKEKSEKEKREKEKREKENKDESA